MKTSQAASRLHHAGTINFPLKPSIIAGRDVKAHGRRRENEDFDLAREDGQMSKAAYCRAKQQAFAASADLNEWNWDDDDDDDAEAPADAGMKAKLKTKKRMDDSDDWIDAELEAQDLIEAEHEVQRMLGIDELSDLGV